MTNLVILTGRLARDSESREAKGGTSVTGITVVNDRSALQVRAFACRF